MESGVSILHFSDAHRALRDLLVALPERKVPLDEVPLLVADHENPTNRIVIRSLNGMGPFGKE